MKAKQITLFLIMMLLLLAACGGTEEAEPAETAVEPTEEVVEPETAVEPTEEVVEPETAVEPTEEAAEPATAEPAESDESVEGIPTPTTVDDASGATIYVYDFGTMTLHAFVNSPAGAGNGTYIIEGENSLVLIDSHFSDEAAIAFRAYADSLGKPIDRIYLTHEHPDHVNGMATVFSDVEGYATAKVIELAAANFEIEIGNIVEAGSDEIDGIAYEFEIFQDTESQEALLIKLPDYGVMAAGDLIYNNYHMVMNPSIPNWLDQLAQLEAMSEYELILSGHGQPVDPTIYAINVDYLETALALYNDIDDPDEFQAAMVEAYPDRLAPFYLGLSVGRMYPK